MDTSVLPVVDASLCDLCGDCVDVCPAEALSIRGGSLVINGRRCRYCGDCEDVCPKGAVSLSYAVVMAADADAGGEYGD